MNQLVIQVVLTIALTLLVVARLVGPARMTERVNRRTTCRELRRLRQLVEVCATGTEREAAADAVAAALTEVLHLRGCWFEPVPIDLALPSLGRDGELSTVVQRRGHRGLLLPERIALPAGGGGRFVLQGHPSIGTTPEERLIAAAMASALGLVVLSTR